MAKHRGRGFATIEYPTGMNQNGDPSQAWIKLKPDGRVDVFAGTVDIGQGSKTVHTQIVADALGVPYDWVTMDNSNTDSSAVCTGTFASRGTFIGGNAVRYAAEKARERILDIASKELEIAPDDLEIVEGEVLAKGAPDRKISVPDVAGAATYVYGELITGNGTALKPLAEVDDDDGSVTIEPHSAISYAACVIDVEVDDETGETTVLKMLQVYDVGRAINPTLVEGQIEGGAMMGLGLGLLENSYPYYPQVEHRGGQFGDVPGTGAGGLPGDRERDPGEPLGRRPVRRQGDRRDGQQRPASGDRVGDPRRRRRLGHRDAGDAGARARGAGGQARAAAGGQARDLRRGDLDRGAQQPTAARRTGASMPESVGFSTWNGVPSYEFVDGVNIHAIGGDQVLMCRVVYQPGKTVPRHAHDHTEQLMAVVEGSVRMTIGDETRDLGPGDVVCVNRGIEHELYSETA